MVTIPQLPYRRRLVDPILDELTRQLSGFLVIGPRATGKTTTMGQRATTVIELDVDAQARAFQADPRAALDGLAEPVLLDEWQNVPQVLAAVRRAIDANPTPNRFFVTGSVRADVEERVWPATGRLIRIPVYPMTVREQIGSIDGRGFLERIARGEALTVPGDSPDLRGYVSLALRGGFPAVALQLEGRARTAWLGSYVDDLLTHDLERLENSQKRRDSQRLRTYLEAYALNSSGIAEHKTIYEAAKISKKTANVYDGLLRDLLVVEEIPAWSSNRLKRLRRQPKRYIVDPSLFASILRLDEGGVMADGDLLGRMLETFVAAQLRAEVALPGSRERLFHLRTESGRNEIDLLAELGGGRVVGIEIKADAAPSAGDARHLAWLRDELGDRFVAGVVLHTGPRVFELGERITAAPISTLWG